MKHPGGRPPKYRNPEEMQVIIDRYFAECAGNKTPVTMAGLAYALGMTTRALLEYAKKDKFLPTIKEARQFVESSVETLLLSGNHAAGAIFWLKNNAGWKDKVETEHSGTLTLESLVAGS